MSVRQKNSPIGIAEAVRAKPLFPWFSDPLAAPALRRTDLLLLEQLSVQTAKLIWLLRQGQVAAFPGARLAGFQPVVAAFHL